MARLAIELPSGLGSGTQDVTATAAARTAADRGAERFDRWVGCWAGQEV